MSLLDFGQLGASLLSGNQLYLSQFNQTQFFQPPWGMLAGQQFQTHPEMQALLARHNRERMELQFRLEAAQIRRWKEFAAMAERAADAARIDAAPELWRRLDECRRKHGLPT